MRGEALDVSWTRDGTNIVVAGGHVRVWSVRRDTRSLAELDAIIAARVPWRFVDGRLELVR